MTYQTLGIILKKTDMGEANQLFSIYTQSQGKVMALGRGVKKITSKLNYQLQPFSVIELMVAPGKNYDHIAGATIVKNFTAIKKDFKKIILASFALELIEKLTKLGQPDAKIFVLLSRYLSAVDTNLFSNGNWQIIRQAFIVKLLGLLGIGPTKDIVSDPKKLDNFLKSHLDSELGTEKFLVKMMA